MKATQKKWLILLVVFVLIFLVSMAVLIRSYILKKEALNEYSQIQEEVNTVIEEEIIVEEEEPEYLVEVPHKDIDWDSLYEINEDVYAWVYVPDTQIDYPILQHPTDNNYYVSRNLDRSSGYPGVIISETYNSKDFSDIHTVLYGHNMKDGSMFGSLHSFEDMDKLQEDHYVYVYLPDGRAFVYLMYAATEHSSRHLLANDQPYGEIAFENYLNEVRYANGRIANVREDVEVTIDDKVLTLMTCTRDSSDALRYICTCVFIEEHSEY